MNLVRIDTIEVEVGNIANKVSEKVSRPLHT